MDIYKYFQLGVPSAFSMALDVWAHAMFRFLSGYLGSSGLSGLAIMMDIGVMLHTIGVGLD